MAKQALAVVWATLLMGCLATDICADANACSDREPLGTTLLQIVAATDEVEDDRAQAATPAPLDSAYAYQNGPRVANSHEQQCSVWYGTLEEAKSRCDDDGDCRALHDYNCDGQNWRYCSVTASAMESAGGDTSACTMVKMVNRWIQVAYLNQKSQLIAGEMGDTNGFSTTGSKYSDSYINNFNFNILKFVPESNSYPTTYFDFSGIDFDSSMARPRTPYALTESDALAGNWQLDSCNLYTVVNFGRGHCSGTVKSAYGYKSYGGTPPSGGPIVGTGGVITGAARLYVYSALQDPTATPTASPTPSPTVEPSAAPTQTTVTAVGDPHLKNIKQESFDIRKAGVHTLLTVPRGAAAVDTLLNVGASVERVESGCSSLFIQSLDIMGQWLGSVPPLRFAAGSVLPGEVDGAVLQVGNSSALSIDEFLSKVPSSMITLTIPKKDIAMPNVTNKHATLMRAALKFGPGVSMKVSWTSERIPSASIAHSLWVSVAGLSTAHSTIGGLLGEDDHHDAATPDADCTEKGRSGMLLLGGNHESPEVVQASFE